MQAKLTLTIDPQVVHAAKRYAKQSGTSLSAMVENYLRLTLQQGRENSDEHSISISPAIAKLRGIVKLDDHDAEADPKVQWLDHLSQQHS